MSTVTLNGTRLNGAESNTNWSNFNISGGSPGAEPQLKYQGTNAVNKKVNSTSSRGGVGYGHTSTVNMTTTSNPLWLVKAKVADAGDLNTTYGCEVAIGSSSTAYYSYNVSGSGANNDQYSSGYNSQGGLAEGYIITAINPNVSQWRESTTGSPSLTGVDFFAFAAQFITGGAKSENVALDAIDVGVGLNYNGTLFTLGDGADTDQDINTNRWGFSCRNGSVLTLRGVHTIGSTSSTSGTDTSTVLFPDGYHGTGDAGFIIDTANASVSLNGSYTGLGRVYGSDDTRPDLLFSGNDSNTSTHSGNFINFNNITLRSSITVDGGSLECKNLTQASAEITNSVLRPDTASGVAMCDDATFGVGSGINNTSVIQSGLGHAFEITSTGSITLDNLTYSGFGSDGTNSAVFYNNSGGSLTINVTGGDTPTVRNGVGATTTILNTVVVRVIALSASTGLPVENARVLLEADAGGNLAVGTDILSGLTDVNGVIEDTAFNYSNVQPVVGRVRKSSSTPYYKTGTIVGNITSAGFETSILLILDE